MERTRYIRQINIGLGKFEQGITSPLVIKKIDEKVGMIMNSSLDKTTEFDIRDYYNMSPTRIILLTNITNANALDKELLHEIEEEK